MNTSIERAADMPLNQWGHVLAQTKWFGCTPEQAITKVVMGRELGISDTAAMTNIHVIQGKPVMGSHMIAAAVKRHPCYDYRVVKKTARECSIEFFEERNGKRESLGVETFTIDDAKAANLTGKAVWRQFPKNMLFSRAIANGYRTYCPDVFDCAVYAEGEIEDEVIDTTSRPVQRQHTQHDVIEVKGELVKRDRETGEQRPINGRKFTTPTKDTVLTKDTVPAKFWHPMLEGLTLGSAKDFQGKTYSTHIKPHLKDMSAHYNEHEVAFLRGVYAVRKERKAREEAANDAKRRELAAQASEAGFWSKSYENQRAEAYKRAKMRETDEDKSKDTIKLERLERLFNVFVEVATEGKVKHAVPGAHRAMRAAEREAEAKRKAPKKQAVIAKILDHVEGNADTVEEFDGYVKTLFAGIGSAFCGRWEEHELSHLEAILERIEKGAMGVK